MKRKPIKLSRLIAKYVPLKKRGRKYVGTCPLCSTSDSLFVYDSKNLFWCFGCKRGGDALVFIMEQCLPGSRKGALTMEKRRVTANLERKARRGKQ